MKVRITFEDGDCVEEAVKGRTFENSGTPFSKESGEGNCHICAFNIHAHKGDPFNSACVASTGCNDGVFIEVTETQTKEEAK